MSVCTYTRDKHRLGTSTDWYVHWFRSILMLSWSFFLPLPKLSIQLWHSILTYFILVAICLCFILYILSFISFIQATDCAGISVMDDDDDGGRNSYWMSHWIPHGLKLQVTRNKSLVNVWSDDVNIVLFIVRQ